MNPHPLFLQCRVTRRPFTHSSCSASRTFRRLIEMRVQMLGEAEIARSLWRFSQATPPTLSLARHDREPAAFQSSPAFSSHVHLQDTRLLLGIHRCTLRLDFEKSLLQWGHGISAVEMVLTDIAVLLHVLAHNASASVFAPQSAQVVQPTPPPFFKQAIQIHTVTKSRALPVVPPR